MAGQKEGLRLACPFALVHQEHYKSATKSNCTTIVGFADRQLLRQHIISQHLALCPRCFETKTLEGKVPDKNFERVLGWRIQHLRDCKQVQGHQHPPPGTWPFNDDQVIAFQGLDKKPIIGGTTKREQEFVWWKNVFRALYPKISSIPEPDTRYYIPRPDLDELVDSRVRQKITKIVEIVVHATNLGQVGLPNGVIPDPGKYQQLGSLIDVLSQSPEKLDVLRLPKELRDHLNDVLLNMSEGPTNSDSGYESLPRSDMMDLDEGVPPTGTEQTDFMGMGAGTGSPRRRGRDTFEQEMEAALKRARR